MQRDGRCSRLVPCLQKLTLECLSGPWELHMMAQSYLESETAAVEVIPQVRAIQGGAQAAMLLMRGYPSCCRRHPSICGHHEMQQVEHNVSSVCAETFQVSSRKRSWRCLHDLLGFALGKRVAAQPPVHCLTMLPEGKALARCSCIIASAMSKGQPRAPFCTPCFAGDLWRSAAAS